MIMIPLAASSLLIGLASPAVAYLLTSTSFNKTSWEAQPYVANGYIGQRIPAEGMGYYAVSSHDLLASRK